jgi:hypothetical protein
MAILAAGLLFAASLSAQTPAYFPLEVGNTWLYRAVTISPSQPDRLNFFHQSVRVTGTEKIAGREYFSVSYFGRDVSLRVEPSTGDVVRYDKTAGAEVPWISLSLPVGSTFPTSVDPCSKNGEIISRTANVAVPVGDFSDEIEVNFQLSCADAGVTKQYYASNVGLVRDEQTTIAGPVVYRLTYFRAGTNSNSSWGEVSFTLGLDAPWFFTDGILGARLTLRNNGSNPVNLHFTSGQSFDFKIINAAGEIVYTWSADKSFVMMIRDEQLDLGELTYGLTAELKGLPAGRYTAQAFLTTDPITYMGQVAFEIVAPGRP